MHNPADAGMNRSHGVVQQHRRRRPRARGDEPSSQMARMRPTMADPAEAGMDRPTKQLQRQVPRVSPHTRE